MKSIGRLVYKNYKKLTSISQKPLDIQPIFINSLPKSGTHLITSIFDKSNLVINSYEHVVQKDFCKAVNKGFSSSDLCEYNQFEKIIKKIHSGYYMTAHLPYDHQVVELLMKNKFNIINIVRDPRDIALSHAHYVLKNKYHFLHKVYKDMNSFDECLLVSIRGMDTSKQVGLESIDTRLRSYFGWVSDHNVLTLKFENLVGEKGGSTKEIFINEVQQMIQFLDAEKQQVDWEHLEKTFWGTPNNTFRKGTIGDWKNYYKQEHIDAFNDIGSDLLNEYGYSYD